MKQHAILIGIYAALLIIGGIIGYITAGSLASILMSLLFALPLIYCSFQIAKGNTKAYDIALALLGCLVLFFAYRFFTTFKIAPGGIMMLLSGLLLGILVFRRSSFKQMP